MSVPQFLCVKYRTRIVAWGGCVMSGTVMLEESDELPHSRDSYVSAQAAADYLGVTRLRVYQLLDTGVIESTRYGRRRLVLLASLAAYVTRQPVVLDVVPLPPRRDEGS